MPPQPQPQDDTVKLIVVMGPTGTGKSTFINLASKSHFDVNHGQVSYTDWVQVTEPFYVGRDRVVLIDTPGFDDTSLSDKDVLNIISVYLESSYVGQSVTLAGVLYFHDISAVRIGGIAPSNFHMLRKFCGEATLKKVVIVTNKWGEVKAEVGKAREAELKSGAQFYKPAFDKGARIARHGVTGLSAEKIIEFLLSNYPIPLEEPAPVEKLSDTRRHVSGTDRPSIVKILT